MTENEKTLNLFTTRIRQMVLRFKEMKKENEDLYAMVDEREREIKTLKAQLLQSQRDYETLKMAKMLTVSDGTWKVRRNACPNSSVTSTSVSRC